MAYLKFVVQHVLKFLRFLCGYPGLTTDGSYLYWGNAGSHDILGSGTIGRASLDGTDIDNTFITGLERPSDTFIYGNRLFWSNSIPSSPDIDNQSSIGVSTLGGKIIDEYLISGIGYAEGMFVFDDRIYWTEYFSGNIGTAGIDGTGLNRIFLNDLTGPSGLVVVIPETQGGVILLYLGAFFPVSRRRSQKRMN